MARQDVVIATCDPCDYAGASNVPAVTSHVLSIDGGPELEVDFCAGDDRILQSIFRAYRDGGRPVPSKEKPAPARKPRAKKAVKAAKPKELEPPAMLPVAEEEPAAAPATQAPAEKPKKPEKPRQYLACPLDHKTGGSPKRVVYDDRNSHASMIHNGAKIWEIHWQDPDGILPRDAEGNPLYACHSHAECQKTVLAFTTAAGLRTHKNSSPLPRIDQDPSNPETP